MSNDQKPQRVLVAQIVDHPDLTRDLLVTYEGGRRVLYRNVSLVNGRFEPGFSGLIAQEVNGNTEFEEPR